MVICIYKNCRHSVQSIISFFNIQYATCFDRSDDPQALKNTALKPQNNIYIYIYIYNLYFFYRA